MNQMNQKAVEARNKAIATGEVKIEWMEDASIASFINALFEITTA